MVSQIWVDFFSTMLGGLGFTGATGAYLFAVLTSLGIAMTVAIYFKHNEMALPTFYFMLLLWTVAGAFEWLFLVIGFIPLAIYYYKKEDNS
jgi:hypothetical protein